jgi:hypothetical protein
MFGLPKSTEINKLLPKKAIFERFKLRSDSRRLFDEQISRLAIVAEISPQTVNLTAGSEVAAIYVIHLTLKSADCDRKNIALLSKLIDQRLLFMLQYEETARLAVCRAGQVLLSEIVLVDALRLNLVGLELDEVWENIIASIGNIDPAAYNGDLDAAIKQSEYRKSLEKQLEVLKKQAYRETQPRRKLELVEKIRKIENQVETI